MRTLLTSCLVELRAVGAAVATLLGRRVPAKRPPVVAFVNGRGEPLAERFPRTIPSRHPDGRWS